jgi:hypothetical protein
MTTNNNPRPKLPPAAMANHHFLAINTFFSYFQKSCGKNDLFTLKGVQNKPNFFEPHFIITACTLMTNDKRLPTRQAKNKPNSNPIQTQTKPISTCISRTMEPKITYQLIDSRPRPKEPNFCCFKGIEADIMRSSWSKYPKM